MEFITSVFKLENIIYIIVTVIVVIMTTIRQFSIQDKKNQDNNDQILDNLFKIENQNGKILYLLELHSHDIKMIKKDISMLENRISRIERSHADLYEKLGGKKDDNS